MNQSIGERAMLISLNVSQWTARRFDKAATDAAEKAFAAHDAGRFNKTLVEPSALKAVASAANAARTFHYEQTLPWSNDGGRILPAANFLAYSAGMRKHRAGFEAAADQFAADYPALLRDAPRRLNGMFNAAEYPLAHKVRDRFTFETAVSPLPTGEDFRVSLGDAETARIRDEIAARLTASLDEAHADLYRRLAEAVGNIAGRLGDPEAIFRDSLLGNLRDLVELLPRLDLKGDNRLDQIRRDAEASLLRHDPQTLREDKVARAETARDANAILAAMEGMYK